MLSLNFVCDILSLVGTSKNFTLISGAALTSVLVLSTGCTNSGTSIKQGSVKSGVSSKKTSEAAFGTNASSFESNSKLSTADVLYFIIGQSTNDPIYYEDISFELLSDFFTENANIAFEISVDYPTIGDLYHEIGIQKGDRPTEDRDLVDSAIRGISTRYDERTITYLDFIAIAALVDVVQKPTSMQLTSSVGDSVLDAISHSHGPITNVIPEAHACDPSKTPCATTGFSNDASGNTGPAVPGEGRGGVSENDGIIGDQDSDL
jgi:hypothetical protein